MKKRHDKYGPLMSSRQNLYGSIYYRPDDCRVTVGTEVPYAAIHNEGLRAGRGKGFKMPKRQFMGERVE
jgi:phage gpG-like protein